MNGSPKFTGRLVGLLPWLWSNWIALFGTTLTTVAGNAILIVTVVDIVTGGSNQYAATFGYMVMPPFFALGLLIIAVGAWLQVRRERGGEPGPMARAMAMVLRDPPSRRRVVFVVVASVVNLTLVSVAAFQAISFMDTPRFFNIILNAIQAMPDGGEVRLSAETDGDRVRVRIRDNGPGIDEEKLDQIFRPFMTTKQHGTGLGLAICARLVKEMNGSIAVDSRPGHGACFEVSLATIDEEEHDARGHGRGG